MEMLGIIRYWDEVREIFVSSTGCWFVGWERANYILLREMTKTSKASEQAGEGHCDRSITESHGCDLKSSGPCFSLPAQIAKETLSGTSAREEFPRVKVREKLGAMECGERGGLWI